MPLPEELSFDNILKFMLDNGGKVTNHELVKHFKVYLTDPANRVEARETFKKHVNTLASIKNQNNEKWLILKQKYIPSNIASEPLVEPSEDLDKTLTPQSETETFDDSFRSPPPYKPPPEFIPQTPTTPTQEFLSKNPATSTLEYILQTPTTAQDRLRPQFDMPATKKISGATDRRDPSLERQASKEQLIEETASLNHSESSQENLSHSQSSQENLQSDTDSVHLRKNRETSEEKERALVKERKKLFTRSNGEGESKPRPLSTRKSSHKVDVQKRSSVMPQLDPKGHEWIVRASAGDYQTLGSMCAANPGLVKIKDPVTGYTALHWAAKKGDERLVKLLSGIYQAGVHEKTNGGYTPLHIAAQFGHDHIYKMLVEVFDADPNVTDFSGRKARQYPVSQEAWSPIIHTRIQTVDGQFRVLDEDSDDSY